MTKPQSTKYSESEKTLARILFACWLFVPSRTSSKTARGGTNRAVASKGAASLTHIETVNVTRPTQRCARGAFGSKNAESGIAMPAKTAQHRVRRFFMGILERPTPVPSDMALLRSSCIRSGERVASSSCRQRRARWPSKNPRSLPGPARALRLRWFSTNFFCSLAPTVLSIFFTILRRASTLSKTNSVSWADSKWRLSISSVLSSPHGRMAPAPAGSTWQEMASRTRASRAVTWFS
mmetsp:Transcript_69560/g.175642  ORF Transcript_69560/g.175642 Transcript_69560/m.175642 type:complete len:237 (-) Transcript_69560:311-1021(-)